MTILETHIVPKNVQNIRLSDYAIGLFSALPSRKGLKKAIKNGALYINGTPANTGAWIQSGQKIDLIELDLKPPKIYPLKFPIIYEDEYLAIINKPAGILVSGNQFKTIQNALLYNLKPSKAVDAYQLPKPVHRLDAATSGLLIIAKTAKARIDLGNQFEQKQIQKRYQAIIIGAPTIKEGILAENIENKAALTKYETLETIPSLKVEHLSLVNLYPKTGRRHQLRIHLSNLGHPILGDKLYCKDFPLLKGKGLFLCAVEITFRHPIKKEILNFKIDLPAKFQYRLGQEKRRWEQYNGY